MQLFHGQLKQMTDDFDFMKRNREEAKKQLDARFQDIERYGQRATIRKIQNSRDFIASEGKRTNDTLYAFQHKFEHELKSTKEDFDGKLTTFRTETEGNFNKVNSELTTLTNKLS